MLHWQSLYWMSLTLQMQVQSVENFDLYKHLYIYESIWHLLAFNLKSMVKMHLGVISLSFEVLWGFIYNLPRHVLQGAWMGLRESLVNFWLITQTVANLLNKHSQCSINHANHVIILYIYI
jgi:hypothetical protein